VQKPRVSHFPALDGPFHVLGLSAKLNAEKIIASESESTPDVICKEAYSSNICGFEDT
jgi:hypothetical protein